MDESGTEVKRAARYTNSLNSGPGLLKSLWWPSSHPVCIISPLHSATPMERGSHHEFSESAYRGVAG